MPNSSTHLNEQALFESALSDPDQLLLDTLRSDERRRRRRRWMFTSLLIGGIAMFTAIAALAGWLTLAAPAPPGAPPNGAVSAAQIASTEAWVERLKGLRDHMHTAFGVGPDLTLLDPDQGVEIVRQAWPQLTNADVKTGVLKTFAFSRALPKKHPKLFQVLDLGMKDSDPKIREYATAYLEEYAGKEVASDPTKYAAWFAEFGEKDPEVVLKIHNANVDANFADGMSTMNEKEKLAKAESLATEGWKAWQQMRFADAVPLFEKAVELDPGAVQAWNGLGWSKFNSGHTRQAIPAFEKCILLEPKHPGALNGLGQVYLSRGDFKNAERYLKKAAPNAPAAWFGLGRLYLLTGKYNDAAKWLRRAQQEQPNDPTLQQMLAAATAKSLPDELRKQIKPAGGQSEDSESTLNAQGWQLFFSRNYVEAEAAFRKILAEDPKHLAAMNGLGFSLLNQGKTQEARPHFERILALEPNSPGPLNGLARCLRDEGDLDAAIAVWERALEIAPGPNDCSYSLGLAYAEKGQMAKAIPLLEMSLKANPDDPQIKRALEKAGAAN